MLSSLSQGYGRWDGTADARNLSMIHSEHEYNAVENKHKHGVTLPFRNQKSKVVTVEEVGGSLNIPKTYLTRKGALVLYSSEGKNVPQQNQDFGNSSEYTAKVIERLGNVKRLMASVLYLNDIEDTDAERSVTDERNKIFLGFLRTLDNVICKQRMMPGHNLDVYLKALRLHVKKITDLVGFDISQQIHNLLNVNGSRPETRGLGSPGRTQLNSAQLTANLKSDTYLGRKIVYPALDPSAINNARLYASFNPSVLSTHSSAKVDSDDLKDANRQLESNKEIHNETTNIPQVASPTPLRSGHHYIKSSRGGSPISERHESRNSGSGRSDRRTGGRNTPLSTATGLGPNGVGEQSITPMNERSESRQSNAADSTAENSSLFDEVDIPLPAQEDADSDFEEEYFKSVLNSDSLPRPDVPDMDISNRPPSESLRQRTNTPETSAREEKPLSHISRPITPEITMRHGSPTFNILLSQIRVISSMRSSKGSRASTPGPEGENKNVSDNSRPVSGRQEPDEVGSINSQVNDRQRTSPSVKSREDSPARSPASANRFISSLYSPVRGLNDLADLRGESITPRQRVESLSESSSERRLSVESALETTEVDWQQEPLSKESENTGETDGMVQVPPSIDISKLSKLRGAPTPSESNPIGVQESKPRASPVLLPYRQGQASDESGLILPQDSNTLVQLENTRGNSLRNDSKKVKTNAAMTTISTVPNRTSASANIKSKASSPAGGSAKRSGAPKLAVTPILSGQPQRANTADIIYKLPLQDHTSEIKKLMPKKDNFTKDDMKKLFKQLDQSRRDSLESSTDYKEPSEVTQILSSRVTDDFDDEGLSIEEMNIAQQLLQDKLAEAKRGITKDTQEEEKGKKKKPRKGITQEDDETEAKRKELMLKRDQMREMKKLEKQKMLADKRVLQEQIAAKQKEKATLLKSEQEKIKSLLEEEEQLAAMAEEARIQEEAARVALAESRRLAKEERERKRKEDLEKKKEEAIRRRESQRKMMESARMKELEMLEQISDAETVRQLREQERIRREEEEWEIEKRIMEEEKAAKLAAKEEEERISKIEREAEEAAMERLVKERMEAERMERDLEAKRRELEALEMAKRAELENDEQRFQNELRQKEEEELQKIQEEYKRIAELKRLEMEMQEQLRQDMELRRQELLNLRQTNIERKKHLELIKYNQEYTKPWVFSYYVKWPRETYEALIGGDSKKKKKPVKKAAAK